MRKAQCDMFRGPPAASYLALMAVILTLAHEVRDDAVEAASLEGEGLAHASHALLTCRKQAHLERCDGILCSSPMPGMT
jgi:hypothetical protein